MPLLAVPFLLFFSYNLTQGDFSGFQEKLRIFSLLFLIASIVLNNLFIFPAVQKLSGVSQKMFQLRARQSNSEEVYLLLFVCPSNRQTIFAAKMSALFSYYFLINLLSFTLPTLVLLL